MIKTILIINAGSSSIKFALVEFGGNLSMLRSLYRGVIEDIGMDACFIVKKNKISQTEFETPSFQLSKSESISADNHETALQYILSWLSQLPNQYQLVAVGHRVVHGGMKFSQPLKLDESTLAELWRLEPLHQPHALRAIESVFSQNKELIQIACFDTAFHADMPMNEQLFALPYKLAEQGVRRYGFHGLSYGYIASVLPENLGEVAEGRVVVAHLGHGISLCAMKNRVSIATTMSFTPLDGLPMATRCGAIDAAVVLYLMGEKEMTLEEVSDLLHNQSGLLGLSGLSGDIRTLLASDSTQSVQAIAVFILRIHRELGSLTAALGGLEALVFTGGIGEHSAVVREQICHAAQWLGIALDEQANHRCHTDATRISSDNNRVSVWVIPTDEEQVIANHTVKLLGSLNRSGKPGTVH